jgi:hypothetical protein
MSERNFTIFNEVITTAISAVVVPHGSIPISTDGITASAVFTRGGGGTTAKAWIQTSFDDGDTWIDIINFAFTTSSANKVSNVSAHTPLITGAPTDGTLADNTILDGVIGSQVRVKYTTTGTYTTNTTLKIDVRLHN